MYLFQIWNHPDVLYNFLRKRSEVSAAFEEDLDLEELGGVTKAGRAKNKGIPGRKPGKPRVRLINVFYILCYASMRS